MTDIQGSTRLWEQFPEAMPLVVRRHEEILLDAISANQGKLIKSKGEGDSTFSVFEHPGSAVRAATEAQLAMTAEEWPAGVEIKVRMAVHTGQAEVRDADYFGPTINRCARIREVGHGGQVLTSAGVHALANEENNLSWIDHGIHRLRDLLRPEHLWQVQPAGLELSFPKLKSLSVMRNNLPVQLTSFIGRQSELDSVKRLMQQHRLVNVVGFGGEGKTRLVLQLGADIDSDPNTCIWFVALDSLRTGKEVNAAIMEVLGGDNDTELDAENVRKLGLQGLTWLILDNAEHLISILRPVVALLLREAPSLKILVSSREPLHLQGEVLYRIPGLSLPAEDDPSIEALERSEAGQLFLSRAIARSSDFKVSLPAAKSIGEICRLLNGVPLAIEQAAPLVGILSPAQILARLKTRMDWLKSENPDVPERHRSLAATIQWSYELLPEPERRLFLMLSLFRDSFTLEAATYLARDIVATDAEAVQLLRELVDKSMVNTIYDEESEVRFRLLEPLRQFAETKVGDAAEEWMNRYVDWYIQFSETADAELYGPNQVRWLEQCSAEEANFRQALEWCHSRSDKRLRALAFNLRKFWMRKCMFSTGRKWLGSAFEISLPDSIPSSASLANVLGAFASKQHDHAAALAYFQTCLDPSLAKTDPSLIGAVLNNLAITLDNLGRLEEADEHYRRAIAAWRTANSDEMLSFSLLNYSITQRKLQRFKIAETCAYEALTIAEGLQDKGTVAMIHSSLCSIAFDQNQPIEAATHAAEALALWERQPSPDHLALLILKVACLALDAGDAESATRIAAGAQEMVRVPGAENDGDFLQLLGNLQLRVANQCAPSSVAKWQTIGRRTSGDELVTLARYICLKLAEGEHL